MRCRRALTAAAALLAGAACGSPEPVAARAPHSPVAPVGAILRSLPETIDPGAHYLIYHHNQFLETAAPGQEHPQFGPYQYEEILAAFAERRLIVVAERREPDADPAVWADRVVRQVRMLIASGAPPEKITVAGFSKGLPDMDCTVKPNTLYRKDRPSRALYFLSLSRSFFGR